jgi:hypothetical protein
LNSRYSRITPHANEPAPAALDQPRQDQAGTEASNYDSFLRNFHRGIEETRAAVRDEVYELLTT